MERSYAVVNCKHTVLPTRSRLREIQEGHAKQYANTFEYTDCKTSVAIAAAPAPRLYPVRTAR